MYYRTIFVLIACLALLLTALSQQCVECHKDVTPKIVADWQLSVHSEYEIGCAECHGEGHTSADDVVNVKLPTPETCAECHQDRYDEFMRGKHAIAWAAMKAMPTTHWQPMALREGMKGKEI